MKHPLLVLLLLLSTPAVGFIDAIAATTDAAAPALPKIFSDKDFAGWKVPTPNPFWQIKDGVLTGENDEKLTGSMLWTEKSYGDFVMEFEARWNGEIDSGVMFRTPDLQLQIGVSRSLKRDLTGSFYTAGKPAYPESGQAKNLATVLKPGDWNKFRLEARGTTFSVWMNGQKCVEYVDAKFAQPGPLGLQIHAGLKMKVEFRNLHAKAL